MNNLPLSFQNSETVRNSGRVNIMDNQNARSYPLYQDNKDTVEYKNEALKGIQISSPLSQLFFCKKNVEDLHNMIRYNVWIISGKKHIIDRQSDVDLHVVMRSFYLQYSQNQNTHITQQIKQLNTMVLDWVIPKIMTQIEQYLSYKKDVSGVYKPMEREVNTSVQGTNTLELKNFF